MGSETRTALFSAESPPPPPGVGRLLSRSPNPRVARPIFGKSRCPCCKQSRSRQRAARERRGSSCVRMSVANEVLDEHDQSRSRPGGRRGWVHAGWAGKAAGLKRLNARDWLVFYSPKPRAWTAVSGCRRSRRLGASQTTSLTRRKWLKALSPGADLKFVDCVETRTNLSSVAATRTRRWGFHVQMWLGRDSARVDPVADGSPRLAWYPVPAAEPQTLARSAGPRSVVAVVMVVLQRSFQE